MRKGRSSTIPACARHSSRRQPLSRRLRDPRTIISLVLPLVLVVLIAVNLRGNIDFAALGADRSPTPTRWLLLVAPSLIYYAGLSAPRLSLAAAAARRRNRVARARLNRDHLHQLAGQLPRARPSSATSIARGCYGQLRRLAEPHLRHGLHRAHLRPVRDCAAGPGGWLLELSRPACRPRCSWSSVSGWRSSRRWPSGLFLVRNFGRRLMHRLPLPGANCVEFYDRFEEGVFSIDARRVPWLADRDGAHLGNRGDAPVPGHPGPRFPDSAWASAAPSSWR